MTSNADITDIAGEKKSGSGKCALSNAQCASTATPAPVDPAKTAIFHCDETGTLTIHQGRAERAFGSSDPNFIVGISNQIFEAGQSLNVTSHDGSAFTASLVAGVQPRDEVEGMLAAQMAAIHNATMKLASRINRTDIIQQYDSASRSLNQLSRTFAAQVEALTRYRSGGQQKMTVEHVHVHDGGQAIVGNVSHEGKTGGNNAR